MKTIPLFNWPGEVVLVDDDDYAALNGYVWFGVKGSVATPLQGGKRQWISMHVMLLGRHGTKTCIDHIDGDCRNNQRSNLRLVTRAQNTWNQKKTSRPTSSRYKGVCLNPRGGSWVAYIQGQYLGSYRSEQAAALVYDREARKRFGVEFALCNFPDAGTPLRALRTVSKAPPAEESGDGDYR